MKIYPFNQKQKNFYNWSNYLNWIDNQVISLQNYLDFFNPNFVIKNQSLSVIKSNTWESIVQPPSIENFSFQVDETGQEFFDSSVLRFREGVFIPRENIVGKLNNTIKKIKVGRVLFAKRQQATNLTWSDFIEVAQPMGGYYLPNSGGNVLSLSFDGEAFSKFGTSLFFSIERQPGRYILNNGNTASIWEKESLQWSQSGAYWTSTNSNAITQISNSIGQVWTNSYPLMHEIYIKIKNTETSNTYEEIFLEENFSAKNIKIQNHLTAQYNINRKDRIPFDLYVLIF